MLGTVNAVEVKKVGSPEKTRAAIFDELRRDLADWMTANRDLVWRPALELTEEDGEFAVRALIPGVRPKDIEVLVAPERLLLRGLTHRGEPAETKILASVAFPRPVNPSHVHAEFEDGMLAVKAEIAGKSRAIILMPHAA